MPLYRLSAQECQGFIIDDDPTRTIELAQELSPIFISTVRRLAEERGINPERCEPGLHNLTPAYWRTNRFEYYLCVAQDGESGLFYTAPKDLGRQAIKYDTEEQLLAGEYAGFETHVVSIDEPIAPPIMGPIEGDSRIRLHELVIYSDVNSP